jgi:hypothetical protein
MATLAPLARGAILAGSQITASGKALRADGFFPHRYNGDWPARRAWASNAAAESW